QAYPWRSLLGELGFVLLRGLGFMMTIVALQAFEPSLFFPILGAFSVAWLLGLVVPGAPGGVGVFEAVAIALLGNYLSSGLLLTSVALYRLISTLAEALGAGLIWLEERITQLMKPVAKAKRRLLLMPATDIDLYPPEAQDSETPETVQPETVQPETIQPDGSEPEVSEPDMSKPEISELDTSEPKISEPDTSEISTSETVDAASYSASLSSTNKG
ncbi:flippase-like domain-containing protein, partial [Leptolyngbya cf. ectocarpi LEGE 11479]